jgi:eukaryotic-like serine/threonine-protein kinase
MRWLSDDAVTRLRDAGSEPELSGTPYRMLDRLGRGGMGSVYLVEDARLNRRVAMKVLDAADRRGDLEARLLREARVLAQLEHPGIVPVHDVGTLADGRIFYTMKYVQGRRLDEIARGASSSPERLRLFQKICEPVAFAHSRGVLHRDLKPENIMVGPFGEVLVIDWGIAKVLAASTDSSSTASGTTESAAAVTESAVKAPPHTAQGAVVGTPGYMAPEQARGEIAQLDQRADIFSLGAILKFLISGSTAATATTSLPPRRLSAIVAKATAPTPGSRYASAQDLASDIASYLDGYPVSAYPESLLDRTVRLISRNRVAIVLVLAYLLARVLLILWHPR